VTQVSQFVRICIQHRLKGHRARSTNICPRAHHLAMCRSLEFIEEHEGGLTAPLIVMTHRPPGPRTRDERETMTQHQRAPP
jgi:hypothetical protein